MSVFPDETQGSAAGRPPVRAAVAAIVLLALLALVAAATGGGRPVTGQKIEGETPHLLVSYAYTFVIVLFVAIIVGVIVVLLGARRVPVRRPMGSHRFLLAVAFAILLATALAPLLRKHPLQGRQVEEPNVAPREVAPRPLPEERPTRSPEFRWELAIALGAVAAAVAAYVVRRRRGGELSDLELPDVAEDVSFVLDEAVDDLRAEQDARRAVIAAYARLEATLARHGFARRPAEAPLEYLSRILRDLSVRPSAVLDLTELFEQAKFSIRPIDASMKEEAIGALTAVRDDLRAPTGFEAAA